MPVILLRRRVLAAFSLCLLSLTSTAAGQQGRELNNAVKDIVHVWSAPTLLDKADLPGIATLIGATGVTMFVDEPVHAWLREHSGTWPLAVLAPFQEGGPLNVLGRSYFLAGSSAVLFLAGMIDDDVALRNAGRGCASSAVATTISRHFLARLLGRTRPRDNRGAFVIRPLAWGDWDMRSFPAGHAANAMACITFLNERFDLGAAEPLLYGLAAAVGAGRMADEAHWASDVVFGLGYGHAIGREMALRQKRREPQDAPVAQASVMIGLIISF